MPLLVAVGEADDVTNDVIHCVDEGDMSSDGHIPMVSRRGRQLAAEVARHAVGAPFHVAIVRLTGAEAAVLFRLEAVPVPQSGRGMIPMLAVPALRDLTVVVVELLLFVSILRQSAASE